MSPYASSTSAGLDAKVQVMTNHASLAAQQAQRFAGDNTPCVLAGDFNFKCHDAPYKLITQGNLNQEHPHMPPTAPHGDTILSRAWSSANVQATGSEPSFTNLASNAWGGDTFCETLDYIFLSTGDGWSTRAVRELPSKEQRSTPLHLQHPLWY